MDRAGRKVLMNQIIGEWVHEGNSGNDELSRRLEAAGLTVRASNVQEAFDALNDGGVYLRIDDGDDLSSDPAKKTGAITIHGDGHIEVDGALSGTDALHLLDNARTNINLFMNRRDLPAAIEALSPNDTRGYHVDDIPF